MNTGVCHIIQFLSFNKIIVNVSANCISLFAFYNNKYFHIDMKTPNEIKEELVCLHGEYEASFKRENESRSGYPKETTTEEIITRTQHFRSSSIKNV